MKAGIAGAGIMGRLLALSLVNAGWDVSIFDQDDGSAANSCSMTALGLLTPIDELEKADLIIYQLGTIGLLTLWPEILNQLHQKIYFAQTGTLIVSHSQDNSELERLIQAFSNKLKNIKACEKVSTQKILQLEPELTKFNEGYYLAEEGHLDNQTLLAVLRTHLQEKNVHWFLNNPVNEVQPGKIILQHQTYSFDMVFDCRGLGAKTLFKDLRGVRGEALWLHAPEVTLNRSIRLAHPRYSLYIVPRPNHIYIIGASVVESEDYSPVSVRTALELLTAAFSVHPAFAEARIMSAHANCRPALPDHLPKIKYSDGLIAINGLYRHGFLIGPAIAKEVMEWIKHGQSAMQYPQLWEKCA
jgi:glycine oxidase